MLKRQEMWRKKITLVCVVFLAIFHIASALWILPHGTIFRHVHLGMMLSICAMQKPFLKKPESAINYIDFFYVAFLWFAIWYVCHDISAFSLRTGSLTMMDQVIATIYILIVFDVGRRLTGWIMCGLAVFFVVQNLISDKLVGIFYGPPIKFSLLVDYLWMRNDGIFGSTVQTVSSYVILFMIFASLLNESGAGTFFIELAQAATGKSRGGPAKTAVIASMCFGSISGSSVANVAGTGSITIPMMKKSGYPAEFAGAVEAVASTGGQIMPPMMGSAAFLMAGALGISYVSIAQASIIPAILYYLAIFIMVDFRAAKLKMHGLSAEELPSLKKTLVYGGHLLIPLIAIIYLMLIGRSAQYSAIFSTITLIALTFLRKWTRMDGKRLLKGIFQGVIDTSIVAGTAALAGLIVGGLSISGLGLVFAQKITAMSGGRLWLALILIAVAALIMGMGMSTMAVYITVATIMAPALEKMGVFPLAAHLFVFFFGIIGTITPPVAMTAFTAAGIAQASPSKTGWAAFKLGLSAYIIPFMFVYCPELLAQGSIIDVAIAFISACVGIWMLAGSVEGWMFGHASPALRLLMGISAFLTIKPGVKTDLLGLTIIVFVVCVQLYKVKRRAKVDV